MADELSPEQTGLRERLREIFSGKTDIVTELGDATLTHHLRKPTTEEDLLFRKRSTSIKVVGSRAEPSDDAFRAPISFYDTICESVSVEIDGETSDLPDFKNAIDPDMKAAVISAFQNRFKIQIGSSRIVSPNGESE